MNEICDECGEQFYPEQRYFAAPKKVHVMCRKYRDEILRGGAAMHQLNELRKKLAESVSSK